MRLIGINVPAGLVIFLTTLLIYLVGPAYGQSNIDPNAASLASRVGVATTKLWLEQGGVDIPPSTLPPEKQYEEIESALKQYETLRDSFAGVAKAGSAMEIGVAGITGGLALLNPITAPVPLLIGSINLIGLNVANDKVEEIGKDQATKLLAVIKNDLIKAARVKDFSSLVDQPSLLRDTIINSTHLLKDVKARASESGDQALIDMAVDTILQVANEVDIATLDEVARLGGTVAELDAQFDSFVQILYDSNNEIVDRLDHHKLLIDGLGSSLEKLGKNMTAVREEVQHLGHNQDLLVDFMFSDLPPDRKVLALRSGLMDDRIQCPQGSDATCNRAKIRATLIERYETEATITESIATAGKILQGINNIQTITANLGIDIGEEGFEILKLASGAVNAYMSILSGNPLGAIAAVTSIFSNRPDPDAERFKIMMKYMEEQFGVINEQLDAVLENQQIMLDAMVAVSEQIQQSHEILDSRLRRMEWEQHRTSTKLRELIWAEWRSCYAVYSYTLAPNSANSTPPLADPNTLGFKSFAHVRDVIEGRGEQISQCLSTVTQAMVSVSATRWFGSFLDTRRALMPSNYVSPGTLTEDLAEETRDWRTKEQRHWEDVANPVMAIVAEWARRNNVSPNALLRLQMLRISNARELHFIIEKEKTVSGYQVQCNANSEANWALRELICVPNTDLDKTAQDLMGFAINSEILLEIVSWMEVLSQIVDLYRSDSPHYARTLEELATFPNTSRGEEIIRKSVSMIGLAMAYYSRTYGGIAALAIAEDILSGAANKTHQTVLANNPYLAENTALLLLHLKRGLWNLTEEQSIPSFENIYAQALLHARSASKTRFDPLFALFDREHGFSVNDKGRVGFNISIDDGSAFLPLPPPMRLFEGEFSLPPRYLSLVARQDRLINKYFDYQLGKNEKLSIVILQR